MSEVHVTTEMARALDPAKVTDSTEGRNLVGALALDLIDAREERDAWHKSYDDSIAEAARRAEAAEARVATLEAEVRFSIEQIEEIHEIDSRRISLPGLDERIARLRQWRGRLKDALAEGRTP